MLSAAHTIVGLVLVASHAVFLVRALVMRRRNGRPGPVDRLARLLSHLGLPAAAATGILAATASDAEITGVGILHIVLGLAPFGAIIGFAPLLAWKRRHPWVLPTVTMALFAAAAVTGYFAGS